MRKQQALLSLLSIPGILLCVLGCINPYFLLIGVVMCAIGGYNFGLMVKNR